MTTPETITDPVQVLERDPTPENIARITKEAAAKFAEQIAQGEMPSGAEFLARNPKVMADQLTASGLAELQPETQARMLRAAHVALDLSGNKAGSSDLEAIRRATLFIERTLYSRPKEMSRGEQRAFSFVFQDMVDAFADATIERRGFGGLRLDQKYFLSNLIGAASRL